MLNLFIGLAIGGTAGLTVGCLLVSAKTPTEKSKDLTTN